MSHNWRGKKRNNKSVSSVKEAAAWGYSNWTHAMLQSIWKRKWWFELQSKMFGVFSHLLSMRGYSLKGADPSWQWMRGGVHPGQDIRPFVHSGNLRVTGMQMHEFHTIIHVTLLNHVIHVSWKWQIAFQTVAEVRPLLWVVIVGLYL